MAKLKKYVVKISDGHFQASLSKSQQSPPVAFKDHCLTHDEAVQFLNDEFEKQHPDLSKWSFHKLATHYLATNKNIDVLRILNANVDGLIDQLLFVKILKDGIDEAVAEHQVAELVGKNRKIQLEKCLDHTMDAISDIDREQSVARAQALAQYGIDAQHVASSQAKLILDIINNIPGHKIVTILTPSIGGHDMFDVDSSGHVGYAPEHLNHLYKQLDAVKLGTTDRIVVMIRQFIPNSESDWVAPTGKTIKMPWKAVYAFDMIPEGILPCPADELERCYSFTPDGKPIPPEEFVIYKDFAELLH